MNAINKIKMELLEEVHRILAEKKLDHLYELPVTIQFLNGFCILEYILKENDKNQPK